MYIVGSALLLGNKSQSGRDGLQFKNFKSRLSGLWRRVVLWLETNFSEVRRNVGIQTRHYTASQPRRLRLEIPPTR